MLVSSWKVNQTTSTFSILLDDQILAIFLYLAGTLLSGLLSSLLDNLAEENEMPATLELCHFAAEDDYSTAHPSHALLLQIGDEELVSPSN